ncbi:CsiV family protein [Marinicella meishanensis]|uniref:CsiV family protein n=1 Tax=Marinicella meishanensis TaxID=2873263 RepID=UPI001CBC00BF|nr:CsiV family protein [Marinicella sp. NBU2979]
MTRFKMTAGLVLTLAMCPDTTAQEYLRLAQDDVVYDVDVVVFARRLQQPSVETFNNAPLVATDDRRFLPQWDPEWPLLNFPQPEPVEPNATDQDEWQVPIEETPQEVDALVWVAFASNPNHPVLQRLSVNPNLKPLLHQKWRQPASAFLDPEYVTVSTVATAPEAVAAADADSTFNTETPAFDNPTSRTLDEDGTVPSLDDFFNTPPTNPDYSLDGQVAFSQQRFTHLHVKMNLFRINQAGESIVHAISQQRRVKLGEWQYFDHQHFGVLAKVTEVSLQPPENEENEHETDPVTGVDDIDPERLSTHQTTNPSG